MISDLLAEVATTLDRTARVRVWNSTGPVGPTRKRRDRRPVLADQQDTEALKQLRAALAPRPDTEVMDWMQWPNLWLDLHGRDDAPVVVVGLLHPGWIRWSSEGDLELQDPAVIVRWLTRWAPAAASTVAG